MFIVKSLHVVVTIAWTTLLFCVWQAQSKVVVLLPTPHVSYVRTHTNVGRALTELGHDAYVCVPHYVLDQKMADVEGVKVIAYGEKMEEIVKKIGSLLLEDVWNRVSSSPFKVLMGSSIMQELVRSVLGDKQLLETLTKLKPDMFVVTNLPPAKNMVILPYMLDVPFVFISPFYDFLSQRVPFSPAATPCFMVVSTSGARLPSFMDRLKNTACHTVLHLIHLLNDDMVAEFAPHRPQISPYEISLKAELFIVETDHIMDYPKPALPNTKMVGSAAPTPPKVLLEPFKSFVEGSKSGVAVVTFGSAVLDIPSYVAEKMASAFQQQELNVVWRVNFTSPSSAKIMTSTWIPQNDLLGHAKTKLFVSHCGANGQNEALYHGVPMLCLPLVNDGFFNARRSEAKGFGLSGNILDMSDKELVDLMKEVSENPKYGNNIKKASELFRQLYKFPVKEAAYWIDHVMQYGGSYMRAQGQEMPLYQYLMLDIFAFILGLLILFFTIMCLICCCSYRLCRKCCHRKSDGTRVKRD